MFKRILVPLDGSKRAERALPVAAHIVRKTNGSLVLLRVVSMATELWPYVDLETEHTQVVVETELFEAAEYLRSIAAMPEMEGIPVDTVVVHGPTAATMLNVALSHGADLIALCSRGYTGMTRRVMGSTADKIARHSTIPVLVLRDGGSQLVPRNAESALPLRVLVALDGSSRALASLLPAASLAHALASPDRATLHLARVVEPVLDEWTDGEGYPLDLRNSEKEVIEATCYLSTTVEQLRTGHLSKAVDLTWSAIIDTDVARGIVRMAECLDAQKEDNPCNEMDLIAISTQGYGSMQDWMTGGVAQRVLNMTRLPLLIVHPLDMGRKQDAMMEHINVTTIAEMQTIQAG